MSYQDPEPPNAYDSPEAKGPAGEPPLPSQDERTMATVCHLTALVLGFIGPLIIWLLKKDEMPFVDDQGKEALNFQITVFIATMVSGFLMFVLIGFLLLPLVLIFDVVMIIIAALKANAGEVYRYPLCIRFIS